MLDQPLTPRAQAMSIIETECAQAGLTRMALQSDVQAHPYLEARRRIALRLHNELGYSAAQIAPLVGRERTTVLCYLHPVMRARKNSYVRARRYGLQAVREVPA